MRIADVPAAGVLARRGDGELVRLDHPRDRVLLQRMLDPDAPRASVHPHVAAGIDGMLALRLQHRFGASDIASIALGIPRIIEGRLTNKHPVDLQAAQMSLPFSVAVAAKVPFKDHVPDLTVVYFEAGPEAIGCRCTRSERTGAG